MLSRRSLFTRLSALALAPLAKWLPKVEAAQAAPPKLPREGFVKIGFRWERGKPPELYWDGVLVDAVDSWTLARTDDLVCMETQLYVIPQEEA